MTRGMNCNTSQEALNSETSLRILQKQICNEDVFEQLVLRLRVIIQYGPSDQDAKSGFSLGFSVDPAEPWTTRRLPLRPI